MSAMRKRWNLAAAFGVGLTLAATASPAHTADSLTSRLDRLLEQLHEHGAFDGAVAITSSGKLAYARGFGLADRENGVPFTPDTPSDGASLAKPVTAAAVLLLAETGRIDLDAPVRRWVPEYPHATTTIRQLLSHSGGLPDYGEFQALLDSGRPVSTSDLLREIGRRNLAPAFSIGSQFAYCNLCYDALALVVERASREPYGRFVHDRLFLVAGMSESFVRPARFADWPGVRTRAYRRTPDGAEPFDAFDNEGFYGGGNIYFTTRDLATWASAWSEGAVLPPTARRQGLTIARVGQGPTGLTLGNWYCSGGGRRCYYTGHHQGFHNFAYWDADRRASVVFMSNNTLSAALQMALPRALIASVEGRTPEAVNPARAPAGAKFDAAAAAGRYRSPNGRRFSVRAEGPLAYLQFEDGPTYRLFSGGWGAVYAPGLDVFLTVEDGALRWDSIFERFTAERVDG